MDPIDRIFLEAEAGQLQPETLKRQRAQPKRADFRGDIYPFAFGMGLSAAIVAGGVYIIMAYVAGWLANPIRLYELLPGLALALVFFGVGYGAVLWRMQPGFTKRLLETTTETARFTPAPLTVNTYAQVKPGKLALLPEDPRPGALHWFLNGILVRAAPLTEAGANEFGFTRAEWESLRDWLLNHEIIAWKNDKNHKAGLELNGAGAEKALFNILNDLEAAGRARPPLPHSGSPSKRMAETTNG